MDRPKVFRAVGSLEPLMLQGIVLYIDIYTALLTV